MRKLIKFVLLSVVLLFGLPSQGSAQEIEGGYVNFSFDQVDVRLLVKLVGEITGKKFVIDDGVSGKVTVITPNQIPQKEVYPLFLSILEASGYSVLERNGINQVVSLTQGGVAGAPLVQKNAVLAEHGLITRVFHVEHINAVDLKKSVEMLIRGGKEGRVSVFAPSNHLIVTDTGDNIARLDAIIQELDKPGASRTIEIVKLNHASAPEIAAQLMAAVKGMATANNRIQAHFKQLASGSGSLPTEAVVVPSTQANSLILVGTPLEIEEIKKIVAEMDVEPPSGYGRLNAIFLRYLSAEEAAKSLNALLEKSVTENERRRIAIEPSMANNALIVDAAPQDFQYVKGLVDQLDSVPQQVMVEVLIAEITLNNDFDLGVDWGTVDAPTDNKNTIVGRSQFTDNNELVDVVTKGLFPQGLTFAVTRGTYTTADGTVMPLIPFMLRAMSEDRDVKILSKIPLWAQNNQEASVSVVNNIPILKSTIEGGSGTARDVIQNIERMDVGIKLNLTPHVNPDRDVTMKLNPSIEAVIEENTGDVAYTPTIAKREVSTTVTIPDKATVVISGLIREDKVHSISKIPLLGDIPLLGKLFQRKKEKKERTNLLIFVTPNIVTDLKTAMEVSDRWQADTTIGDEEIDVSPEPDDQEE